MIGIINTHYILLCVINYLFSITNIRFHLEGDGGICPPLEFVCQYAHYDKPVCCPLKVFQIHICLLPPPPPDEFSNRNAEYIEIFNQVTGRLKLCRIIDIFCHSTYGFELTSPFCQHQNVFI